jgi:hypothetical protein
MRIASSLLAAALLAACASTPAYGPASRSGAAGFTSQAIETGRYQITYTDTEPLRARNFALLRAAEITLLDGKDWFEVVGGYTDAAPARRSGGTSVSVGGARSSGGRSSVGVGVGLGIPLGGGGGGGKVTEMLEITTGSGDRPDRPNVYDARAVEMNLRVPAS